MMKPDARGWVIWGPRSKTQSIPSQGKDYELYKLGSKRKAPSPLY